MGEVIVSMKNIVKTFPGVKALDNVNFELRSGEVMALLGENGAGKSTLLKIIVGELEADSGNVVLAKGRSLGYLAQHQDLESGSTIYQELLSVKQDVIDLEARIRALEEGGDAYLSKPFSLREMLAQAKALMMRPERKSGADEAVLSAGPFQLDGRAKTIRKDGQLIALSPREFQLASALMGNAGKSLSRDTLLAKVWGAFAEVEPQTVSVHMSWLRAKLEDDPAHPVYFKTVRGEGYRFDLPEGNR